MAEQEKLYEDRYLLFFDILGFRDLVERSAEDQRIAGQLLRVFDGLKNTLSDNQRGNLESASFSDTVCHSIPATGYSIMHLFMGISVMAVGLLGLDPGYPVRGAITRGLLYHKGNVIFGPCINRAHYLESKIAIYPRVIIDPIIDVEQPTTAPLDLVHRDSDGLHFVNVFSPRLLAAAVATSGHRFEEISVDILRRIDRLLEVAPHDSARQKLRWLQSEARNVLEGPEAKAAMEIQAKIQEEDARLRHAQEAERKPIP